MSVRTGRGDKGLTDLSFHKRVSKDSPEICAMGDLDELASFLGLVKVRTRDRKTKLILEKIQHALYKIATEIAVSHEKKKRKLEALLKKDDTDWIKTELYQLEGKTKIKSCFCVSGGGESSALFDIVRAVARRAERSVVRLYREEKIKNSYILSYLNCLSDVLFVMARELSSRTK